jgi:hypothetical protein
MAMITCKECKKEMSDKVKKCPNCGYDARNLFMRHKIISFIGAFVLLVAVLAVAGGQEKAEKVTASGKTEKQATKKEEPKKDIFALNEEVKLVEHVLTVTKFEASQGAEYFKPKEGMEYIICTVKIKNIGKENISYNPYNFKLQTSKGNIVSSTFMSTENNKTSLSSGELAPNGEVEGTLAFETNKDDTKLILEYEPNFLNDKKIKVLIKG